MKVYGPDGTDAQNLRLLGRAEVPPEALPVFEARGAGGAAQRFAVGVVTHLPPGGGAPVVERTVLLAAGQAPDALPGWRPLNS